MKVNYNRLLELNREALVDDQRSQLASFYIIQSSIEKYISGDVISQEAINLLLDMGVLEPTEEDIAREQIVGPFNFSQHGTTNT
tara:strand:- start:1044 stop:1295 length:252 start_codon:yes stop_codon:yes gene_type:complete